jgi:DnaJ family protein C protein 28
MQQDDRWQSMIDQEIQKMMSVENVEHLPGFGKPLKLDNDTYTPDDMRMAYKIMRDNDIAPEWIALGKDLEAAEQSLHDKLDAVVRSYRGGLADSLRAAPGTRESIERRWQAAQRTLKTLADKYNAQVGTYNLKVPPTVGQRRIFNLEREIERALKQP